MKFVFNDIFASDSNLFAKSEQVESVIVSSNLILEKNIKTAQVTNSEFADFVRKYKDGDATERARIVREEFPKMSESQQKDFTRQIQTQSNKGGSEPNTNDTAAEKVLNQIIEDSEQTGEAGKNLGRILVERNKIESRLRSSGFSPDEIAKLFNDYIEQASIPETLVLTFLEDGLDYASQARTSYKEVLEFMLVHYTEQLDADLTRNLTKLASQVKSVAPDVPIFEMLLDAAKGKMPDLSMIPLIEDEEKRSLIIEVMKLAQLRVVGQGETARRQWQHIRDRMNMIQEQANRQRAIVDMLETIEVDKFVTQQIQLFGDLFVKLMTTPMYRTLRSMLYDIAAARKILDAYGTLYLDNQPVTPRQTDREQRGRPEAGSDISDENVGSAGVFRRQSSKKTNFVKISQFKKNSSEIINKVGQIVSQAFVKMKNDAPSNLSEKGKIFFNLYIDTNINYWSNITTIDQIDNADTVISKNVSNLFKSVFASNYNSVRIAQIPQQGNITPVDIDKDLEKKTTELYLAIKNIILTLEGFEALNGNFSGIIKFTHMTNNLNTGYAREVLLQQGVEGVGLPGQSRIYDANGNLTDFGKKLLAIEEDVNKILFATQAEQNTSMNLVLKRKQNRQLVETTKQNLENDIKMTVDLGDGSGETPLARPEEIEKKYISYKKLLTEVIKQTQFEKDLNKRAFDRIPKQNLDPFKIKLIESKLTDIDKDLKLFENEYGRIGPTSLIIRKVSQKLRLMQKIGPIQKAIAKFKKAGLSTAALISSPNGFLKQLYLIRKEEEEALDILLKEYEKIRQYQTPVDLDGQISQNITPPSAEANIPTPPKGLERINES
jgi:hypothetical protein